MKWLSSLTVTQRLTGPNPVRTADDKIIKDMILLRQKTYSKGSVLKRYKLVLPKHDAIDAKMMMEEHYRRGGTKEADRFVELYHKLTKPHKYIQKVK